ncbi:MAG: hypothetical protein CVU05_11960 [Bacteroidetes bacterium HGW-Bacteroidetes-21]|jgi:hypothetical protein|nr:MAG: hypothetical protein CVU05_11960 [Bacteroidetes bacterium HGW-Bacteroidetes-21]
MRLIVLVFLSLITLNVSAQFIYTNIEPDVNVHSIYPDEISLPFILDINNDSNADLKIEGAIAFGSGARMIKISAYGNTSLLETASTNVPFSLTFNDTISANDFWTLSGPGLTYSTTYISYYNNKFVGLRVISNNDTLFGWLRMDFISDTIHMFYANAIVKDYYLNLVPGQEVIIDETVLPLAENINAYDVSDNKNGSDLYLTYDKAINESKVSEYRAIIVKESDASTFNLISAKQVLQGNYLSMIPNGMNFSDTLASDVKDKDGNLIVEQVPYRIFVLTLADGVINTQDYLSQSFSTITLNTYTEKVSEIFAEDIYNNNNSSDIQISFNKISDESTISEYRIIGVNLAECDSFSFDSAAVVESGNYQVVSCNNSNYEIQLESGFNDNHGNPFTTNTPYRFFVMTVANGTTTTQNSLSRASNTVTYSNPNAFKAGQYLGNGVYYFNVDPDSTVVPPYEMGISSSSYDFDLNNDGQMDFTMIAYLSVSYGSEQYYSKIIGLNNNKVASISTYTDTLREGDMINKNLAWNTDWQYLKSYSQFAWWPIIITGLWDFNKDRFLGLNVITGTDTIYGWIRLQISSYNRVIVKDYACLIPSNIVEESEYDNDFGLFPNPASDIVNIIPHVSSGSKVDLEITDLCGKTILKTQTAEIINTLDVSNFPCGVYLLKYSTSERTVLKKLIVERKN